MKFLTIGFLTLSSGLLVNCSSLGGHHDSSLPESVLIEFKGNPGEMTYSRYYSNARILTYEQSQLVKDRTEGVDFLVRSRFAESDPQQKILRYEVKTMSKDGAVELHDLAFPELGEQIEYTMRTNGEVLRAGQFPPQSIFYVPSLPIAKGPVKVGDTWAMEHTWMSSHDGIPLRLNALAILKDIVRCEKDSVCADVEISGDVALVAIPTESSARFSSRMWGRLLFSLRRGDVIWSEMRSREESGARGDRMLVSSCMISEMKSGEKYHVPFNCDPTEQTVPKVPTL